MIGRSLRDYVRIARHRALIILLVTIVVVAAVMAITFAQQKKYTAATRFTISQTAVANVGGKTPQAQLDAQLAVLRGAPMQDAVRTQLGFYAPTEVSVEGNSGVVRVETTSPDPAKAAAVAGAYPQLYPTVRAKTAADNYAAQAPALQQQLDQFDTDIADVEAQRTQVHNDSLNQQNDLLERQREIQLLQDKLFKQGGDPASQTNIGYETELTTIRQQLLALQADLDSKDRDFDNTVRPKQALRDQVSQQLDAASLDSAVAQSTKLDVLTAAAKPSSPSSPKPVQNGVLALIGGLILGLVIALFVDYFRDTVDTVDELEGVARPLETLAVIPRYREPGSRVITASEVFAPASAAYHLLRTSIGVEPRGGKGVVIQITSPDPQAGKTTTAVNLAAAFSMAGNRVVIVDADMRRPRVHEMLEVDTDVGLASVLTGDGTGLGRVVVPVQGYELLCVLPAGTLETDPTTILSSSRLGPFFDVLREVADVIIVDTPPILVAPDAAILASHADAVIFLVRAGHTMQRQVRRALDQLHRAHSPLVGTVFNEAPSDELLYRGGYAGYYSDTYTSAANGTGRGRVGSIFGRRKGSHAKTDRAESKSSRSSRSSSSGTTKTASRASSNAAAPPQNGATNGSGATHGAYAGNGKADINAPLPSDNIQA